MATHVTALVSSRIALTCSTELSILLFNTAGTNKVEVRDQQIQTEIVEMDHHHVQAGSKALQQGVYTLPEVHQTGNVLLT